MKKSMKITLGVAVAALAIGGLHYYKNADSKVQNIEETEEVAKVNPVGPSFNADSAYAFTKAQCDFGPRDMNSRGHDLCGEWIVSKFKEYGCKVTTQTATLAGYDGTKLRSRNIMASINPEATTRILLCAHWDSRPWADNDPDSANWRKPILAANDAASGVAVMLELARIIGKSKDEKAFNKQLGIDFVCFDAEDWGTPQWADVADNADSWALGAQYWSKNLPQGYEARYGILLDMVGGVGAKFYREGMSMQYAPEIVKKVWRAAREVGFGSYFPKEDGGVITDDHVPVNQFAKIPTIDIIPYYADCQQSSFGPTWHTLADNMENIDKNTLKAVGQTLVQVIYKEK
ncbi:MULTISPECIES: M28 family peptidase [Prevotellaceae]|jgi:glutamine cyclotransferase-related protein|uniref:M28 family peptidase n=1 Tax=Prevotellaceae TaxID=171552 RepID=UPI0008A5B111|nr:MULTISPECIES: M28 family peptidase [Prevotellaceae]OFO73169.1 glutamine cyclotransferase [Prevotella sp. HMSC077E08]OFP52621.1 glutamine cyclotransferase [Prevotella sp. HMSC077E09]